MLSLKELSYVVFDLETTGFYAESGDEIIEFGAVVIENMEITSKTFLSFVNPGRSIPAASTAVHGITDSHVKDAPSIAEVLPKFLQFVGNRIWVAQNAKFDMSFVLTKMKLLNIPMRQTVVIDTIGISKILFPYETSHSLDKIMARLGIARTGDRHRSLDDSKYTAQALIEFIKILEKQQTTGLTQIESAFIKPESVLKAEKVRTKGLFS